MADRVIPSRRHESIGGRLDEELVRAFVDATTAVVCIMDAGHERTQIVTTGLSTESSIRIVVALGVREVGYRLGATVVHDAAGMG